MLQLPQHQLMQECLTRWGSTLSMLKRLGEQQAVIAAVLMEGKVRYMMPEGGDWTVIEELVNILQKVTEECQRRNIQQLVVVYLRRF